MLDSTQLDLNDINYPVKNRASSSDKGGKTKEKVVAPICGEIKLPKESIKTQNLTNGINLITPLEAPAPEVIAVDKLRTGLYVNSVLTGETIASAATEKRIPEKKKNKITSYVSTKKGSNSESG